jgi:hypothetical protein
VPRKHRIRNCPAKSSTQGISASSFELSAVYRLGGSRDTPQVDAAVDGETVDGGKLTSGELEVVDGSDVLLQLGHVLAPINTEVTRGSRKVQAMAICARDWSRPRAMSLRALMRASLQARSQSGSRKQ